MSTPPPGNAPESAPDDFRRKGEHPLSLIILVIFSLLATSWNLVRLVQGILFWPILNEYGARPGAWYIVLGGTLWTILSAVVAWGLWARKPWAWNATAVASVLYVLWYWSDRLLFQHSHANWLFSLAATVILLALTCMLLIWPGTRQSFSKDNYERQPKI